MVTATRFELANHCRTSDFVTQSFNDYGSLVSRTFTSLPENGKLWELAKRLTAFASPIIYPLLGIFAGLSYCYHKFTRRYVIGSLKDRVSDLTEAKCGSSFFLDGVIHRMKQGSTENNRIQLIFLNTIRKRGETVHSELIKINFDVYESHSHPVLLKKLREQMQITKESLSEARFGLGEIRESLEIESNLYLKVAENYKVLNKYILLEDYLLFGPGSAVMGHLGTILPVLFQITEGEITEGEITERFQMKLNSLNITMDVLPEDQRNLFS